MELLAIAVGGALGAVARFSLGNTIGEVFGTDFPYGILFINILGSFLMGVLFVFLVEEGHLPAVWRSALMVGFLGAFTTFSTFSMQALGLMEEGRLIAAASYVIGSVVLSILALMIGVFICRQLTS